MSRKIKVVKLAAAAATVEAAAAAAAVEAAAAETLNAAPTAFATFLAQITTKAVTLPARKVHTVSPATDGGKGQDLRSYIAEFKLAHPSKASGTRALLMRGWFTRAELIAARGEIYGGTTTQNTMGVSGVLGDKVTSMAKRYPIVNDGNGRYHIE